MDSVFRLFLYCFSSSVAKRHQGSRRTRQLGAAQPQLGDFLSRAGSSCSTATSVLDLELSALVRRP
uniref:Uncharacterized protein n=1 Tax=Arundo donax TaxID=35708 RepID=A0A0A9A9J0_ARUDO